MAEKGLLRRTSSLETVDMSKKSILFVTYPLVCGGVERALLSVLSILPKDKFDVTLLLTEKTGTLLSEVPPHVSVQEIPFAPLDRYELKNRRVPTLRYCLTHFHWIHAVRMLWTRLVWVLGGRREDYEIRVVRGMLKRLERVNFPTDVDYAFAYGGREIPGCFVRYAVQAKVTAIWCHDESAIDFVAGGGWSELYAAFDHRYGTHDMVARINAEVKDPRYEFECIPYFVDPEQYGRQADGPHDPRFDVSGLKLLTVGRLCRQKGIDQAISIAARLKRDGYEFTWFVVGGGEDFDGLSQQIRTEHIEDRFVLLGEHRNPFPYFKHCDIYVQPSRWEAFCLAVTEARVFNRPIVATDFVGAREQLKDGTTGLIVPLDDSDGLCRAIRRLLDSPELRASLSANLSQENAGNVAEAREAWTDLMPEALS